MIRTRRRNNRPQDTEIETPEGPVNFRRLIGYLGPHKLRLSIAIVSLIASSALSLVFPAVVQRVVDSALQQQNVEILDQVTALLLFVFLLRSITSLIENYNLNYIGERILVDIRMQLYTHMQTLSLRFFISRRVGELVSRISNDVTVMRTVLTNNVGTLLQQVALLIGSVIVMFALNGRLTLFILVMLPIMMGIGLVFGIFMRRMSTQIQDELAGATTVADEVLQNIREVKSFTREAYEIERYGNAIDRSFRAAVKLLRVRSAFGPLIAFMAFGGLSLILWFGGREVLAGRLTGGELIAFLLYGVTVAGSFGSMVSLYSSVQEAIGATKRVFQIMDTQPDVLDTPDAKTLTTTEGRLTLDHVSFSYQDGHEILHDISIDVAPGEVLALVGPSGAGKSTIFNLIPRFYDPNQGAILIDQHDLRSVTQTSLRQQIGIVSQEALLFGGTIHENILYGRLDATEAELIAAAKAANAHDFIMELPDQYATVVGERGVRLSGGQRQRVTIARAILKNPRILLLDEATSSLDSESEYLVQEALGRLMENRTTIIIAHRLSTIKIADRIAVIEKGEIVELGTHSELMTKSGLYAKLYEMQFREDDGAEEIEPEVFEAGD